MQLTGSATLETKREGTRHRLGRLRQLIWPTWSSIEAPRITGAIRWIS